jgi:hypothetical protein
MLRARRSQQRALQHYLFQEQAVCNMIGVTGTICGASESENRSRSNRGLSYGVVVAVVSFVALYGLEIWWRSQQERLGNMQLLPTQPSKSHYRLDEDRRLVRVLFSSSFTVLRQISNTP